MRNTIIALEKGDTVSDDTEEKVEAALRVPRGSIQRVRRGQPAQMSSGETYIPVEAAADALPSHAGAVPQDELDEAEAQVVGMTEGELAEEARRIERGLGSEQAMTWVRWAVRIREQHRRQSEAANPISNQSKRDVG